MSNPTFSVIIPSFNRAHLLPRTLRSVMLQTYKNYEIIVIDDKSSDHTDTLLKKPAYENVRFIKHEQNRGAAQARNTGIQAATGDYICFLDSDDVWLPEKLTTQKKLIDETGAKLIGSQSIKLDENSQQCVVQFHPRKINTHSDELLSNLHINTSSLCIEKNLLNVVNGFDTRLKNFEDWDLLLRLAENLEEIRVTNEMLVFSYAHGGNESKMTNTDIKYENSLAVYKKHHERFRLSPKHEQKMLYDIGCYARHARLYSKAIRTLFSAWKVRPISIRGLKSLVRTIPFL